MNEDFDKQLTSHIKMVFDDFGADGAEAGWLLLREKYPPKNNKKPLAWLWWLTAGLCLVGMASALWFTNGQHKQTNAANIKTTHPDTGGNKVQQHGSGMLQQALQTPPAVAGVSTAKSANTVSVLKAKALRSNDGVTLSKPKLTRDHSREQEKSSLVVAAKVNTVQATPLNKRAKVIETEATNLSTPVVADSATTYSPTTAKTQTAGIIDTAAKLKAANKPAPKPLKADSTKKANNPLPMQHIVYGVYASAFYSSAAFSNAQFNQGFGGTIDVRFARHWAITSGLDLMHTTLNYSVMPGSSGYYASAAPGSPPVVTPILTFKNYEARLWSIAVPVNLKYSFGKPYDFISAGLSSNFYLGEYYDQVQTYVPASAGLADVHNVTQYSFNKQNLFKVFDLSFGLGYPLSKKTVLIVEPFAKVPLAGLGSQNLQYGLLGVNFKLTFQSTTK